MGKFKGPAKPGEVRNPIGRVPGRQSFVDRAKHWLEGKTWEEINALLNDPKTFGKVSVYDAMILKRIKAAIEEKDGRHDMDSLLDRILGKPKQAIVGGDDDDKPIRVQHEADADIIQRYLNQQKERT